MPFPKFLLCIHMGFVQREETRKEEGGAPRGEREKDGLYCQSLECVFDSALLFFCLLSRHKTRFRAKPQKEKKGGNRTKERMERGSIKR